MGEWISVKDRLPEHNVDVLIYAQELDGLNGEIAITQIANIKIFPFSPDNWGWVAPCQYFFSNYKITHWKPLPDPPRLNGYWIGIDDYPYETFECDVCGTIVEEQFEYLPKFCPECGSKMKKE